MQHWSEARLVEWLRDDMKLGDLATAAAEEGVDGKTALEMDKEDWKDLGASGIKASKVIANLKSLSAE